MKHPPGRQASAPTTADAAHCVTAFAPTRTLCIGAGTVVYADERSRPSTGIDTDCHTGTHLRACSCRRRPVSPAVSRTRCRARTQRRFPCVWPDQAAPTAPSTHSPSPLANRGCPETGCCHSVRRRSATDGGRSAAQTPAYASATSGQTCRRPSSTDVISPPKSPNTTNSCGITRPEASLRPSGSGKRSATVPAER